MSRPPQQIPPRFVERVWGRTDLSPWFPPQPKPTGEVWFPAGSLLIKFLFTSEPLSVQVHPNDEYARLHESSSGKTEMWHILDAVPGARLALGFAQTVTPEQARQAAEDGTIESLLGWFEAAPGDTYFTPAGTVHALGGGLVLCEIQQNSDITYRLYDYGRGRPLQLERGFEVADLGPHPGKSTVDGPVLVRCPHFTTELHRHETRAALPGGSIEIFLEGAGSLGGSRYSAGQVWKSKEGSELQPDEPTRLLLCFC